ncbi:hypothetical protein KI809_17870 [Geobacter pelophilus]|uniref:Right handed beta helix region n=1 Tax=Geoanaerobacter pelophilus TaxID=60036 RepID=A0AAW4L5D1_9BACT|nr:hypothetical protein [Geoanaerobacter pelophilus]MBT0666183.1 hypothetical protein [Geoanaerobacter pelophilus]
MPLKAWGTLYYVSTAGDDANSGTSASSPWKTIFKLNQTRFVPGDSILFKRGDIWDGENAAPIMPSTSGNAGKPITWGAYGSGPNPVITFASRRNKLTDWTHEGGNIWSTGGVNLGGELFVNPDFSKDSAGWYDQCTGSGANCSFMGRTTKKGEYDVSPVGYKFTVVDHGAVPGNIQLHTASGFPLSFTQGRYYQLTFRAKSTKSFNIPALLLRSDGADVTSGMFVQSLQVGTDWTTCNFMFRADRTTSKGSFNMLLGGSSGIPNGATFLVDSFSCREIEARDFFGMYYSSNLIFDFSSGAPITGKLVQSGALANQGEWYQSYKDRKIRLYSKTNPATQYGNDIIIVNGAPRSGFWVRGKKFHVFQDIEFFALSSAWNGLDFSDIIIQRCKASFTGGIPILNMHDFRWNGGVFPGRAGGAVGATGNIAKWDVRNNDFSQSYDANITWENGKWRGWGDNKKADGIWVYNNILGMAHYNIEFGWNGSGSSMSNIHIYNNTLYDAGYEWSAGQRPDESTPKEDAHIKCWNSPSNGTNINIKNNIMDRARSQMLYFSDWRQWSGILAMNNNLYSNKPASFAKVSGGSYADFADWQAATVIDTVSLYADPLFRSRADRDFHLGAGSPAIFAGADVGLTVDYEGKAIPPVNPDIGALQHNP